MNPTDDEVLLILVVVAGIVVLCLLMWARDRNTRRNKQDAAKAEELELLRKIAGEKTQAE